MYIQSAHTIGEKSKRARVFLSKDKWLGKVSIHLHPRTPDSTPHLCPQDIFCNHTGGQWWLLPHFKVLFKCYWWMSAACFWSFLHWRKLERQPKQTIYHNYGEFPPSAYVLTVYIGRPFRKQILLKYNCSFAKHKVHAYIDPGRFPWSWYCLQRNRGIPQPQLSTVKCERKPVRKFCLSAHISRHVLQTEKFPHCFAFEAHLHFRKSNASDVL